MRYWILSLLLCSCLSASDPWTTEQKVTQGVLYGLLVIDTMQTVQGPSHHPERFQEQNPFLGKSPTEPQVYRYFIAYAGIHTLICDLLPSRYRKYWQLIYIGLESQAIYQNHRVGIRLRF